MTDHDRASRCRAGVRISATEYDAIRALGLYALTNGYGIAADGLSTITFRNRVVAAGQCRRTYRQRVGARR